MNIVGAIFFILHALVHLLYAGQALRFFELRPGLAWPDGSWLLSQLLGNPVTRWRPIPTRTCANLLPPTMWLIS